ncbi:MAG: hypothetical protein GTN74_00540 [Proteobacteria bacterium]|nr:hypothetical protein [Pseudomonadota bacterium]NIS67501.1 hypothetical protein [Pseudomonadota bacterium]
MEARPRFRERRNSVRLRLVYPAIYTRIDNEGRAYDEKPSRSMDLSMGGVRLQSGFSVNPKELFDIAFALAGSLVTFKGEVVYVKHSRDRSFEMGVSIRAIKNLDRIVLDQFQFRANSFHRPGPDSMIIKMGKIVCPNCGKQLASLTKIKGMANYCQEFFSLCTCGQRFEIRISSSGNTNLFFPDKKIELIC